MITSSLRHLLHTIDLLYQYELGETMRHGYLTKCESPLNMGVQQWFIKSIWSSNYKTHMMIMFGDERSKFFCGDLLSLFGHEICCDWFLGNLINNKLCLRSNNLLTSAVLDWPEIDKTHICTKTLDILSKRRRKMFVRITNTHDFDFHDAKSRKVKK
jgi:hypothetical protein